MANLTLIDETMDIKTGATLYHQCPIRGRRAVKVARTTKTLIILEDGGRYSRKGYRTGDTWKRGVLFIEAKENNKPEEKQEKTIEERKAALEARKAQRAQEQEKAEVNAKLDKINDLAMRQRKYSDASHLYQPSIDRLLEWFQSHDVSVVLDNGDYILVEDQEQTTNIPEVKAEALQSDTQLSYSVMRNHEIMVIDAYPQHLDKESITKVRAQVAAKEDALLIWAGLPLASDPQERQRLIKTAMGLDPNFKAQGTTETIQETVKAATPANGIQQCMMPRKRKVDKVFQNRTLKDLETLERWISARLAEFVQRENEAQTLTYRGLKRDIDVAIAEAKAKEASAQDRILVSDLPSEQVWPSNVSSCPQS